MKISIIIGSSSKESYTKSLGKYIKSDLLAKGVKEVELIDLMELTLPFADARYHHNPQDINNENVQYLLKHVGESDAVIIGSPNYHGTFSGILKNAIDILNMDYFYHKPVGLISNSGGMRSTEPITQMRLMVRNLLGLTVSGQIATCKKDYEVINNKEVVLSAEDIKKRVNGFNLEIINLCERLK